MLTRRISLRLALSFITFALLASLAFAGRNRLSVFTTTPASAQDASSESFDKPSLTIGTCNTPGPIEIESTGGDTTPTAYATLNAAFAAINLGTHQGSISVEICGNTTETAAASLDASGVGTTLYTNVTVRPVGGARVIEGSINGTVIKLNGADNVTIDGRVGGVGSGRDLTVRNNSAAAGTAAIWVGSNTTAGSGATNNVIRNLEIAAGVAQNTSASSTFGIIMCGTGISTTSNGVDNDNNSFIANRIIRVRYGITTRGTTTNLSINPIVTDNIIGPSAFGADEIGKVGIFMQADTGGTVSRNTVQFVGGDFANSPTGGADRVGIAIGSEAWSAIDASTISSANYTVTKNIIRDIVEERTFSAVGIKLGTTQSGGATNNLVANNFIYNLRANGTGDNQFCGIGIAGGNGDRIVFNSISITGDMDPGAVSDSTQYGNAIRISGVNGPNNANFTIQNNSIFLDVNSNTATVHFYAITLSSAAYSFGTGGLNYNNYYINQTNTQLRTGGLSTTSGGVTTTEFQTLANWRLALTTLQDANSIQADPLYILNTSNLHLQQASPNISAGPTIAVVTDDIDSQARPYGGVFDIGADEIVPSAANVSLGGSIQTASGQGIRNAVVTLEGGSLAEPRRVLTGPFGYYNFDSLDVGETYILTVTTKRFTFANPTRVITLDDQVTDFDFIAETQQ